MTHKISPSILNASFGNLNQAIEIVNQSKADYIHLDVMDGIFVPNISFGFPVIEAVKAKCTKPLDVHLMIEHPENYIERFKAAGADILTVHYEACRHLHRTLQEIRSNRMIAGLSLNPHTPINVLEDILHEIDMVLIMSVNPGFGGQKFIAHSYEKIKKLKAMINQKHTSTLIEVDGGVDLSNARKLVDCGVDVLVAGSFVFGDANPMERIKELKLV